MNVTVIGYGSLMSGTGLSSSGTLQVHEARIVALRNCRRGFAKLSADGNRFAMDIEASTWPLTGQLMTPDSRAHEEVEALALTLPLEDACRLAKREGYSPAVTQQLADLARSRGLELAAFLSQLHAEAGHDVVAYRRKLFQLTGFTSPHYIPHPVHLTDGRHAVIFLAPGFEGTGSEDTPSVRQQTGVQTPMSAATAWRRKQNKDQLSYFMCCLLGGAHGIGMHDILRTIDEEPTLAAMLRQRLHQSLPQERAYFFASTGLTPERYRQSFGEPEAALSRGGLKEFLS
jgi:hypothetical protein